MPYIPKLNAKIRILWVLLYTQNKQEKTKLTLINALYRFVWGERKTTRTKQHNEHAEINFLNNMHNFKWSLFCFVTPCTVHTAQMYVYAIMNRYTHMQLDYRLPRTHIAPHRAHRMRKSYTLEYDCQLPKYCCHVFRSYTHTQCVCARVYALMLPNRI